MVWNSKLCSHKRETESQQLVRYFWLLDSSWNVMAHGDAQGEKWRGNKRMEWVTSKRHMTAEQRLARAVQTLQADVHSSPSSSLLKWRPRLFKWTRPFRRKTKSDFCACAITFQTQYYLNGKNDCEENMRPDLCNFPDSNHSQPRICDVLTPVYWTQLNMRHAEA